MIRVLFVEDNEDDAVHVRELLADSREERFEMEWADCLRAGLDALNAGQTDVVLLDLALPDSQGLATFDAVHAAAPDVPVVVLSGLDDDAAALEAVRKGAQDYVVKAHMAAGPMLTRVLRYAVTRKNLELQLRQARKMEAIGLLAGGVAHDFRNQLTVITAYSDMLLRKCPANDEARELLQEILKAAERSAELAKDLLRFSRRQMMRPVVVSPAALIDSISKSLSPMLGKDVGLSVVHAGCPGNILVDEGEFHHALVNLAINARQAMPRGGRLTIETADVELDGACVRKQPEASVGPHVMVAVSDTGAGMDQKTLKKLFDPFFTTKPAGQGTGLGLAMVYGFVRQSGGHITVESQPGQGATFRLYFPRVAAEAKEPDRKAAAPAGPARGGRTILLVEDEEAIRRLLVRMLQSCGFTVLVAADAKEAIALSRRHEATIDLLLTDVVMPGMNGVELARQLWISRRDMKVLFMSGGSNESLMNHGIARDDASMLAKPFDQEALVSKVHELLDTPSTAPSS